MEGLLRALGGLRICGAGWGGKRSLLATWGVEWRCGLLIPSRACKGNSCRCHFPRHAYFHPFVPRSCFHLLGTLHDYPSRHGSLQTSHPISCLGPNHHGCRTREPVLESAHHPKTPSTIPAIPDSNPPRHPSQEPRPCPSPWLDPQGYQFPVSSRSRLTFASGAQQLLIRVPNSSGKPDPLRASL